MRGTALLHSGLRIETLSAVDLLDLAFAAQVDYYAGSGAALDPILDAAASGWEDPVARAERERASWGRDPASIAAAEALSATYGAPIDPRTLTEVPQESPEHA